jgi:CubicO group peptidase (beta-lactamase class C family)
MTFSHWACLFVPFLLLAFAGVDKKSASLQSKVDALFEEYNGPGQAGASVLIVRNGRALFKKAYGSANIEDKIAATTRTNYRLASVTKQFTAMSILILVQRNKLSLDDRLTRFFPTFPDYGNRITVKHLLNHTSGLIAYEDLIQPGTTVPLRDEDVLNLLIKQDSTYFEPGTRFRYSNSGYAILALIVEKVTRTSFAAFLKRNIFDLLSMRNTVAYEDGISIVRNRSFGYTRRATGFERTDQSLTSSVLGDGGIYSSVEDLFKWDRALYSERLVKAELLNQAFNPSVATQDSDRSYGFGWFIRTYRGLKILEHSGETIGFRNYIGRVPEKRFTVIVLMNRNGANPTDLARKIIDIYLF